MQFKVIIHNFNKKEVEYYDVMPYFERCYKEAKKKPKTVEEFKEFITSEGKYMFWSRCEWEVIVCGWPDTDSQHKIDVWDQIEANLDLVTKILMDNVNTK